MLIKQIEKAQEIVTIEKLITQLMAVSPGCDYSKVLELLVESNQLIKTTRN